VARLRDRAHAGERLAPLVAPLLAGGEAIVLGIPRGGAIVARALADALVLPLDLLVVRKLGVPGHEEYGFGAIGEDGVTVLDRETVASVGLSQEAIEAVAARERAELERRVAAYAGGRLPQPMAGRIAVIVDDGIAMGGTMRAAVAVCRARGASTVIAAVGVAPLGGLAAVGADAAVAALEPERMGAVGEFYDDFAQTSDAEVMRALAR
jgi:putative phosphoribosyl transferase